MKNQYDIIVIGGGHNGLTTATFLAKKGKSVLLLEKRDVLGGVAAKEEFHPGFYSNGLLHDTSQLRKQVLEQLELQKFGLETVDNPAEYFILAKQNKHLKINADIETVKTSIAKYSKKDAEAYESYRKFLQLISSFLNKLMDENLPNVENLDVQQLIGLARTGLSLKRLGNKNMHELLKVGPMCVADFLNEYFETEFIKAGLAVPSLKGSVNGPWSAFTTLNLLIWECLSQSYLPGGPSSLIDALQKAAESSGVEIHTNANVKRIVQDEEGVVQGVILENGDQINSKVVAASCTPKTTFLELLAPHLLEYPLENSILKYRDRGTTAKLHLAIKGIVNFKGLEDQTVEFARTGNSFNDMEKACDHVKYREFSSEPVLDIYVPTVKNQDLAPEGHSVISVLIHYAPYSLDGGWTDEAKEQLKQNTINTLSEYTQGFSDSLIASEILSPKDLEDRYGLSNGHIFHGEHAPDQVLMRPFSTCSQYTTLSKGLYLCGSGSHPGGGLTCGPGWLAGKAILKDY